MKENECKSVHKRRWLLLCTFSFVLFPLDDGLQKKVLLFAVCCCGVLSCFCGGLRREREREKKREQERVS